MRIRGGEPGPMSEPGPMPVMPPMPSIPAPVAPMPPVAELPKLTPLAVSIPEISAPGETAGLAPTLPAGEVPASGSALDIKMKEDKDGKHVATTEMHFVAKVKPDTPFVIRNNLGRIVLRPSKDGKCDVRAIIQGKAKTSAEAQAKVEQVGMDLHSSKEQYYLEPVRHDGGKWDDLSVDLHITVPPGALLDIKTNLGSVELYDLEGKIKAATNLGSVKAINTTGDVDLFTKMGSIEFIAPKDLSAKLYAQTKMGSIESDLPLEISKPDMFRKSIEGTLGAGHGNIRMTTDMGSIQLRWHSPPQDSLRGLH